jgi:hypothetical protein
VPPEHKVGGSNPSGRAKVTWVRPGDMCYTTFLRHSLRPWAKRVVQGLQSFLLKIDVTEIIVHKADQPDTLVDLFDPYRLTSAG